MSKGNAGSKGGAPITPARASAIQSATARLHGGQIRSGSFTTRAQSAAAHNVASGKVAGGGGKIGK